MIAGSMFGWTLPGAFPQWYLDNAKYVNSNTAKGHIKDPVMSVYYPFNAFLLRYEIMGKQRLYLPMSALPKELMSADAQFNMQPDLVLGMPVMPVTATFGDNGSCTVQLEDGSYTTKEDVALYIHLYGHLPDNFITKKEAKALGWEGGSLEPYAPGKCIGGDRFGNYEGLLPEVKDRTYRECDIDTLGAEKRGAKRIVFSNDGQIYYTSDHYVSFELLYGETS